MSDIAIRVEHLSKRYRIGGPQARYKTIRETLVETARAPFCRLAAVARGQTPTTSDETIWALRDVSFEVKRGEVVGIIGRNGAGKSTLLKILSRITEPTQGRAIIDGRVGSLLEVGTGFHPELTGRENIYLNGAILGMKRAEIDRKFDEIVAFAEIEKFLDTPVKHYSSGMYVRLAFAVAAHLEPEILLVDEVLAVGDAAFQKKCLGKMGDVAREGRTVLFVSHNMGSIEALCQTGILLQDGRITLSGAIDLVIQNYLTNYLPPYTNEHVGLLTHPGRMGGLKPHIVQLRIFGKSTKSENIVQCGDACEITIETALPFSKSASFAIGIYDALGIPISHLNTDLAEFVRSQGSRSTTVQCQIEQLNLAPGSYYVNVAYYENGLVLDHITQAKKFDVVESDYLGTGKMPPRSYGRVVLKHRWQD